MPKTTKGVSPVTDWLVAHVTYRGDECLIWPHGRSRGYGVLKYEGKTQKAHRVMCRLAHGEPPTPDHEAAHSCGRGDDACIHPDHLSWKTRAENQADRRLHGTTTTSGKRRRLNGKQVEAIRADTTSTNADLAKKHGVTRSAIRKIKLGELWAEIHHTKERAAIIHLLESTGRPMDRLEIVAAPELQNIVSVSDILRKMERNGQIRKIKSGAYRSAA